MTSIERTVYPRLTQYLSLQELDFVNVPRSTDSSRLTRLVLLKTHQCFNYFPNLSTFKISHYLFSADRHAERIPIFSSS